ncbi:LIMLP_15305 family protein [Leptospira ilyithenensis]|uniref:Uncharacterized protein n=1 Tax=Leptospira ilyithenensis TaxID=2484901 RepID=A0A4R9LRE2_9LEPT|nr:hypothetical protein [Leptospira ilyithenensis]TGN11083.1 hypothetical protein EHS11_07940 [Leptospira ilyithenensis]
MDQAWLQSTLERFQSEEGPVRKFLKETSLFAEAFANQEFDKTNELVRKEITGKLSSFKESFRKLEEAFVVKAQIQNIGKTTPALNTLERVLMKISSAGFGLNGLGSGFKATTAELESLLKHDFGILEKLGQLELDVTQKLSTWFSENPESAIQNVVTSIEGIEKEFEARNNIFLKK